LRPRLLAGDEDALRDAIGTNRYRRRVPEVEAGLGKWIATDLESRESLLERKLSEVRKMLHPLHEADHRFICGRIGEYLYQGFTRNYAREYGDTWDPRKRDRDTLKKHDDNARRRICPQIRTLAWLYVNANATAPHTQSQPSRQQVDNSQRPE
jgi:hypothetical protein